MFVFKYSCLKRVM